jgi:CRISPR system Cascade subunit CasC
VHGENLVDASIKALKDFRASLAKAYGPGADNEREMVVGGEGTLADIVAFARA